MTNTPSNNKATTTSRTPPPRRRNKARDPSHKFLNLNRHGQSLRFFQMVHIAKFQSKVKPSLLLTLSHSKTKIDLYYKSKSCIQCMIPLWQELNFSLTHENSKNCCVHTMNIIRKLQNLELAFLANFFVDFLELQFSWSFFVDLYHNK